MRLMAIFLYFGIIPLIVQSSSIPTTCSCTTTTAKPQSSCICPLYVDPVCGSDGVTYGNICFFNCAKQKNPKLTVAYKGECNPKPSGCDCGVKQEYKPVCGSDGTTYDNKCHLYCVALKIHGLHKVCTGKCINCDKCQRKCRRTKKYVCGNNDVTYLNKCIFKCIAKLIDGLKMKCNSTCKICNEEGCPCTKEYKPVCGW